MEAENDVMEGLMAEVADPQALHPLRFWARTSTEYTYLVHSIVTSEKVVEPGVGVGVGVWVRE